jgi:hypothetical protein
MRRLVGYGAVALAVLLSTVVVAAPSPSAAGAASVAALAPAAETAPTSCCFTHRSYTGTCVVQPGEGESCSSILDYLNNPMSQGKTYCNSSSLRGGWSSVSCEGK